MFGKNLKLKPEYMTSTVLKVTQIFNTFQGEGPFVGYPAVFIRLSGCNLACTFCDTEFDNYTEYSVEEIIYKIESDTIVKRPLIVITGGEPMRQNISLLCQKLLDRKYIVQIESNGTLIAPNLPNGVKIVCSPKIINGQYHKIRPDVLEKTIAIKFLISAYEQYYCDIDDVGQHDYNIPTYVQPMDEYDAEKNASNLTLAMSITRKNGVILSLQMHKMIGID